MLRYCNLVFILIFLTACSNTNTNVNSVTTVSPLKSQPFNSHVVSIEANQTSSPNPEIRKSNFIKYTPGSKLPEPQINKIKYQFKKAINDKSGECIFNFEGNANQSFQLTFDHKYYYLDEGTDHLNKLEIDCELINLRQSIRFPQTDIPSLSKYNDGIQFRDWNFDGNLDIALMSFTGGSSFQPYYFFVWNQKTGKYTRNAELEELSYQSYLDVDHKKNVVNSIAILSNGRITETYGFKSNQYVLLAVEELTFVEPMDLVSGRSIMLPSVETRGLKNKI